MNAARSVRDGIELGGNAGVDEDEAAGRRGASAGIIEDCRGSRYLESTDGKANTGRRQEPRSFRPMCWRHRGPGRGGRAGIGGGR